MIKDLLTRTATTLAIRACAAYFAFGMAAAAARTFVLNGLDGEWVDEAHPIYDAVGLLYLIACLLLIRRRAPQERPPLLAGLPREAGEVQKGLRGDAPDEEDGYRRAEARV